jgi:hypothetical protein
VFNRLFDDLRLRDCLWTGRSLPQVLNLVIEGQEVFEELVVEVDQRKKFSTELRDFQRKPDERLVLFLVGSRPESKKKNFKLYKVFESNLVVKLGQNYSKSIKISHIQSKLVNVGSKFTDVSKKIPLSVKRLDPYTLK